MNQARSFQDYLLAAKLSADCSPRTTLADLDLQRDTTPLVAVQVVLHK